MAGIEPRQSVSQDQVHNHNTPLLLLMSVVTLPFEPRISPLISNSLNVAMVACCQFRQVRKKCHDQQKENKKNSNSSSMIYI